MINLYVTDFGDVRVSESEGWLLKLADDIRSEATWRPGVAARYERILKRAEALSADCERVARWRLGHA